MSDSILPRIARELGLGVSQIERTAALLDDGNTVPFITRYRKEATGGLDEEQIRQLAERLAYLRGLEARRAEVRAALEQGGHLTPELDQALAGAETLQTIEDIYLPFRPKRRTRAQAARELGLQPLAELLLARRAGGGPDEVCAPFLGEHVPDTAAALAGARDIVAETVAETASVRQAVREAVRRTANLRVARKEGAADEKGTYQAYYEFSQPLKALPPYRVLAINRGEREGVLSLDIESSQEAFIGSLQRRYAPGQSWADGEVRAAVADGFKRLLAPAIERDLRAELTAAAEQHALVIFAANLRGLLLQPPLRGRVVMGVDPGFRTGCKLAVVDATGKYVEGALIYLHQADRAKETLRTLCQRRGVQVIAIGNGTASRETEALVAEVIRMKDEGGRMKDEGRASERADSSFILYPSSLQYTIVSEAGASVYSASPVAREEFPDLDATERGNISIARRLQDPLAELVKIDPKALGVGLYQHDVDQKALAARLGDVVESAVNYVGVDLNTASAPLLTYVAGLNTKVAKAVVAHRDGNGPFRARKELLKVKGLGPKAFEQAAGFLRIPDAPEPLDRTAIHPESYPAARKLLDLFDGDGGSPLPEVAARIRAAIRAGEASLADLAELTGAGELTLADIIEYMARPGRDPREELPPPLLRADVLKLEDLAPGMWLKGTVRNVVDFGAFVDIGVKQDGLVHVSELSGHFVKNPLDVVQVGDQVDVRVLSVDAARGRIALSMRK
ncbi:RNA-binding transcriptional accessory protein [Oscillochloris sp. ZM17-4]|uniref:Tex family protein n=1 Tax=Oscillochloris sp. ZM17-4 TaxID=2866714 RepID=UPI001C73DB6F|nr:Tex family protein [Oscillochloris sp. ZM17-4]MBX0328771.1 RNA-binding transcriptional accessory protein [Oscillochloris sp. ZM17-4]